VGFHVDRPAPVANTGACARILYCESNVDGTIGGSHYCLLHLVERLDRAEFEPIVLFYEEHALLPRFRAAAETILYPRPRPTRWGAGVSGVWSLPVRLLRQAFNVARYVQTVAKQVIFLRRHRIALVHQNNSITRHHDWMCAALIAGVPCIAHERGISTAYTPLDRFFARRLVTVIPVANWIKEYVVARGVSPDNIRVLYDGLDPATVHVQRSPASLREEYGIRPDQPIVGIVGNVRHWKGQETVVRAMIHVASARPDAVCFIVGAATPQDAAYMERLKGIIDEAGISANVRFTGYQTNPASFVNAMNIVLHASVEPEPFGMVVLEAMAQRKPVIGSRAGGVVEMVVEGETGYTVPPGDDRLLAERIIELLGDPARATRMGDAGHKRLLEKFTLQQYMDAIHAIYRTTLGHGLAGHDMSSDTRQPGRASSPAPAAPTSD